MHKTCVIYAGTELTELVSSRWKTQINENSKSKAFIGSMPEVHHNEILSWEADLNGSKENFIIIFLRSPVDTFLLVGTDLKVTGSADIANNLNISNDLTVGNNFLWN